MLRAKVRITSAAPAAEDFRSKDGTPLVFRTDTGALFGMLSDGTVFEIAGATADVVGDQITISSGGVTLKGAISGSTAYFGTTTNHPLLLYANNAEKARLTANGELLVGVTSANANGGCLQLKSGITFPATAVAASDANTLDDYEEGTFTITDASGAGLSLTQSGKYVKKGSEVTVHLTVIYPATGSGANAVLGGLPFTVGSDNHSAGTYTTDGTATTALAVTATTSVALVAAAGGAARANNALSGDTLIFTITYMI